MKLEQGTFTVFSDKQEEVKQENTCARDSLLKKSLWHGCFFCEISQNTFCYETPPVTALAWAFFCKISKSTFCYETPPMTALARVFFCKISKNNFCYETPPVTASGQILNFSSDYQP